MPALEFDYLQSEDTSVVVTPLTPDYYTGLAQTAYPDRDHLIKFGDTYWEDFHSSKAIEDKQVESAMTRTQWFTILGKGVISGAVYVQALDFPQPTYGIGYWVTSTQTERGYATGATTLVSDFLLNNFSIAVIASSRIDNKASRKVLTKSGFREDFTEITPRSKYAYVRYSKLTASAQA